MEVITLATVAGSATAVVSAVVTGIYWVSKPIRRISKQWDDFATDWYGQPARAGVAARPGVMERLELIERQLTDVRQKVGTG